MVNEIFNTPTNFLVTFLICVAVSFYFLYLCIVFFIFHGFLYLTFLASDVRHSTFGGRPTAEQHTSVACRVGVNCCLLGMIQQTETGTHFLLFIIVTIIINSLRSFFSVRRRTISGDLLKGTRIFVRVAEFGFYFLSLSLLSLILIFRTISYRKSANVTRVDGNSNFKLNMFFWNKTKCDSEFSDKSVL